MDEVPIITGVGSETVSPGVTVDRLPPPTGGAPVSLMRFSIAPKSRSESGASSEAEWCHIATGFGAIVTAHGTTQVQAGDVVYIRPSLNHEFVNEGEEALSGLSITWPV